ncbi:hypothetical protein ACFQL4_09130 [Halosimplex aquaticum]
MQGDGTGLERRRPDHGRGGRDDEPRDDPVLVEEYDVRSVPKLLLFVDGELAGTREEGVLSVEDVQAFVTGED